MGGVVLGVADDAAVRAAAERLGAVIIWEDQHSVVDVLCGVVRDPGLGPMVLCGVGGSWAEPMRENYRTMLAPRSQAEAEALVRDVLPVARRLDDAGVEAVARTLVALGNAGMRGPRGSPRSTSTPCASAAADTVALDALVVLEELENPRDQGVRHGLRPHARAGGSAPPRSVLRRRVCIPLELKAETAQHSMPLTRSACSTRRSHAGHGRRPAS